MSTVLFELVTPDRVVYTGDVEMVTVKGGYGELGILPRHMALATTVKPCLVKLRVPGGEAKVPVSGGFLEVLPTRVTLLADAAELPEDIDVDRARSSLDRANARLAAGGLETEEMERMLAARLRAELRLEAVDWAAQYGHLLTNEID